MGAVAPINQQFAAVALAVLGAFRIVCKIIINLLEAKICRLFSQMVCGGMCNAQHLQNTVNEIQYLKEMITRERQTISQRRNTDVPQTILAELALRSTPTREAYLQALAQNVSYAELPEGHRLAYSEMMFPTSDFTVEKSFSFPHGVSGHIIIEDDGINRQAHIVFRGTDIKNIHNLADDVNIEIGKLNFDRYKHLFHKEIERLALQYGRVHVLGHSYGGAFAQLLTTHYPQYIASCRYYNAPRIGDRAVHQYQQNIGEILPYMEAPEIRSYRHVKDIPSLLGGRRLPGLSFTSGLYDDPSSYINAHSLNTLSTHDITLQDDVTTPEVLLNARFIEELRRDASLFIPLYQIIHG